MSIEPAIRSVDPAASPSNSRCPICEGESFAYMWTVGPAHLSHCSGCGLVRNDHFDAGASAPASDHGVTSAEVTAALERRRMHGEALVVRSLEQLDTLGGNRFATVVVGDGVSRAIDPVGLLRRVRRHVLSGGVLVLVQPTVDGPVAGRIGRGAQGWQVPARWHFTRQVLHLTLLRAGFDRVWFRDVGNGRVVATAAPSASGDIPRLSVIVPVFNEAKTCATLLDLLLKKQLPGIEKEVVVVESNSTDGTRAVVEQYRNRSDVKLVFEDRPRGKGHAVRAGLQHATGDLVLIQDADLEYDIEDYETLLKPLLDWKTLFVLGSRHAGDWKMRVFNDAPISAAVFNLGHVFYTQLVNVALRTSMTDPFTMFKVFRRDCLYGLAFDGRRFDFDFELVIKLVRKGYVPIELPVNYTARSFTEGKKVSFFRDGLTWVWVVLKYRFGSLGPGDVERF